MFGCGVLYRMELLVQLSAQDRQYLYNGTNVMYRLLLGSGVFGKQVRRPCEGPVAPEVFQERRAAS
jgi:hypothetical protein